jgi:FkbM family methyltransferase
VIAQALRGLCRATFWPDGSIRRILIGPSSGLRYRLFPAYGLGPVFGRWEPHLQKLIASVLKRGDVAYDVGGNYGIHSLLMARLVGPTGTICTFEPHPKIFAACAENVQLNGLSNVRLLNLALGDVQGAMPFSLGHHDGAGHVIRDDADVAAFTVRCDTIDRLVADGRIPPPTFVKIDVEGHESAVLSGANATVGRHQPVLAVDLHHPDADRGVGRFLMTHGYVAYRQQSLQPVVDLSQGWPVANGIHGSILAVPGEQTFKYPWLPKAS